MCSTLLFRIVRLMPLIRLQTILMVKAAQSAGAQWDIEGHMLRWRDGILKISSRIRDVRKIRSGNIYIINMQG